jgi:hypothetical protein
MIGIRVTEPGREMPHKNEGCGPTGVALIAGYVFISRDAARGKRFELRADVPLPCYAHRPGVLGAPSEDPPSSVPRAPRASPSRLIVPNDPIASGRPRPT